MDPLSIIATSLTIAGGIRVAIAKTQKIEQGRDQIHALANEVSDHAIMLLELEKMFMTSVNGKTGAEFAISIGNRFDQEPT